MKIEQLRIISAHIAARVKALHLGRRTWSKPCGQWLVYGFERTLGFGGSAGLCGVVESHWKLPVEELSERICEYLAGLYREAGKLVESAEVANEAL
jgi:hypothetical protein